jgi:hypothetical protein
MGVSFMHGRAPVKLRPGLERLEAKQLLSAGMQPSHVAQLQRHSAVVAHHTAETPASATPAGASLTKGAAGLATADHRRRRQLPLTFFGYRITNPTQIDVRLIPPFGQVLVQTLQPKPGHTYNVLSVAVQNGTGQTFTAKNNFTVRFPNRPGAHVFPVLTGDQQWLPGHYIVFYVLTKQYYPLTQVQGGFQFDLGGRSTTLVPGPSAIYLRIKYNPATFASTLNHVVAFGPGAQYGKGPFFGLPTTNINRLVSGLTNRRDYGGHF